MQLRGRHRTRIITHYTHKKRTLSRTAAARVALFRFRADRSNIPGQNILGNLTTDVQIVADDHGRANQELAAPRRGFCS